MAANEGIPPIETSVGHKTTTVRLTTAQFEEVDLVARAMDLSMTEFTRKALDVYVKHVIKQPKVQRAVKRQVAHITRMIDRLSADGADDSEEG